MFFSTARWITFNPRQLDWKYLDFVNPLTSPSILTMKLTAVCCVVISLGADLPGTPQDELSFLSWSSDFSCSTISGSKFHFVRCLFTSNLSTAPSCNLCSVLICMLAIGHGKHYLLMTTSGDSHFCVEFTLMDHKTNFTPLTSYLSYNLLSLARL